MQKVLVCIATNTTVDDKWNHRFRHKVLYRSEEEMATFPNKRENTQKSLTAVK